MATNLDFYSESNRLKYNIGISKYLPESIEYVICVATKIPIYKSGAGSNELLSSYGVCSCCELDFHISYLVMSGDLSENSWPIIYYGYYCRDCYELDF